MASFFHRESAYVFWWCVAIQEEGEEEIKQEAKRNRLNRMESKNLRVPQAQARCSSTASTAQIIAPSCQGQPLGSPMFVAFSRVVSKEQIKT